MTRQTRAGIGAALALAVAGCAGDALETVRSATYPPDFHYIKKQEIVTTMGALAVEMDALDRVMTGPGGPGDADRERVIEILSRMKTLSAQLKQRETSNHPRIQAHAPRLQDDISRALTSLRSQPPNYYYAGIVSGSCTYCHVPRHHSRTPSVP